MHIHHVIAPSPFGGAETVVRQLASGQRERGHAVSIAAVVGAATNHPFTQAARGMGLSVVEIGEGRRAYPWEVRSLIRTCRRSRPDLLHSHGYHSDLVALLSSRRLAIPVLATVHGYTGGDLKNRLYEWVDRRILRRFDRVISVSHAGARLLCSAGVSSNRLAVVHNALQPPSGQSRKAARDVIEALDPQLRAKILIGWVGRFTAVKGPDLFVRAVAGLAPDTWQAVMVGDGPERAACRALAQSLGVGKDRLRFLGSQPEAARLIGGFDAIVLSSRSEGVPMVLLEAAALGVPVISFAVGGVPEVLPHDGGWLVPPDDPVSLGAAMTAVLGDMTSARARGARVQAVIREKLSFDHWLDQYDRLYDAVVHHARR